MHVVLGSGQVGSTLATLLASKGERVRVVTKSGRGPHASGIELVAADATDVARCRGLCEGARVVYQCLNAPYDRWPELFPALQAGALEGAQSAGARLVVLENLYMLDPAAGPMRESSPVRPRERKGEVRARMSAELLEAHRRGRVEVAIGRASDFFGPGVHTSQLGTSVFESIAAGRTVRVLGNPDMPHSYSYVPDVARGLAALGEHGDAAGRVWNLPCVDLTTTRALLARAAALAGQKSRVAQVPGVLVALLSLGSATLREVRAMAYQFEMPFVVDDSAARRELGLTSTALDRALRETLAACAPAGAMPLGRAA